MSGPPTLQPVSVRERIVALDALRGFAMIGVLVAYCMWNLGTAPEESWSPLDQTIDAAASFAVDGKFYTILAFLFGLGFSIQLRRASDDAAAVDVYCNRLAVLAGIGLLHALLLRNGDILLPYALTGFMLIPFRRASDRTLIASAIAILLFTACGPVPLAPSRSPDRATSAARKCALSRRKCRLGKLLVCDGALQLADQSHLVPVWILRGTARHTHEAREPAEDIDRAPRCRNSGGDNVALREDFLARYGTSISGPRFGGVAAVHIPLLGDVERLCRRPAPDAENALRPSGALARLRDRATGAHQLSASGRAYRSRVPGTGAVRSGHAHDRIAARRRSRRRASAVQRVLDSALPVWAGRMDLAAADLSARAATKARAG